MSHELQEILNQLGVNSTPPEDPIPRRDIERWMGSEDLEALGALMVILTKKKHYLRITPPLGLDDYFPFLLHYFERCLRENVDGEWMDSSYTAAWSLVNWFRGFWDDPEVPRKRLREMKDWLARLYREGDERLRNCLVTGTLEHLFEDKAIARFFDDWRKDPVLTVAYREAMEWGVDHPRNS
jgi:hypothetical protein